MLFDSHLSICMYMYKHMYMHVYVYVLCICVSTSISITYIFSLTDDSAPLPSEQALFSITDHRPKSQLLGQN